MASSLRSSSHKSYWNYLHPICNSALRAIKLHGAASQLNARTACEPSIIAEFPLCGPCSTHSILATSRHLKPPPCTILSLQNFVLSCNTFAFSVLSKSLQHKYHPKISTALMGETALDATTFLEEILNHSSSKLLTNTPLQRAELQSSGRISVPAFPPLLATQG